MITLISIFFSSKIYFCNYRSILYFCETLFIYLIFWLRWSSLQCLGLSLQWLLLLQSMGLGTWASAVEACILSRCSSQAVELWLSGCGTQPVGSSQTRIKSISCVSCTAGGFFTAEPLGMLNLVNSKE